MVCLEGVTADEIGVEVFEHLAPEIVDGAVAFVGDDEIEGLDRDVRIVNELLGGLHESAENIRKRKKVEVRIKRRRGGDV